MAAGWGFLATLADAKKWLKWVLRLAASLLLTPWIEFDVSIIDADIAERVSEAIKDGRLTDEELADLLNSIADNL